MDNLINLIKIKSKAKILIKIKQIPYLISLIISSLLSIKKNIFLQKFNIQN